MKVLKEPEQIPEGMFPDPRNAFLEQEQREFDEFLDEFLNPANMHLKPYEVMRSDLIRLEYREN